jgi:nucleoid-associated protein YgaU
VRQGDTLATIAHACYGNPRLWRPIALRNRIDDPRALAPGLRLAVPQLPYRDADTGEVFQ